jgi:hypothetical protein
MSYQKNDDKTIVEQIPKELKYKTGRTALITGITGQVEYNFL